MKKKIFFITGSRSEYGQFSQLIKKLQFDKKLNFKLIVTGMHLYKKFGFTYKEILSDKLKIYKKIYINSNSDKYLTVPFSISLAIKKFSVLFKKEKPHLVILPGDRYEILASALACNYLNIPVVHFYGGETSLGSLDEIHRNCISNIAKYHFVSHESSKKKLIRILNLNNKRIYNIGSIALDKIKNINFLSKKDLEKKLNIDLSYKTILFTYHSITNDQKKTKSELKMILKAFKNLKNVNIIFTKPNNDQGHDFIIKNIKNFCKNDAKKFKLFSSLGQRVYYSAIKYSTLVAGNSSSLLYEVPYFKKYSLNFGVRQNKRLKGNSVIKVKLNNSSIEKILFKYLNKIPKKGLKNPYYKKNSTYKTLKKINQIIKSI